MMKVTLIIGFALLAIVICQNNVQNNTDDAQMMSIMGSDSRRRNCGNNERYNSCFRGEATCSIRNPTLNQRCQGMCECMNGFIRNERTGNCIRTNNCPSRDQGCSNNEEWRMCAPSVEPTCRNRMPVGVYSCGNGKCICKDSYIRNNGVCVRLSQCPGGITSTSNYVSSFSYFVQPKTLTNRNDENIETVVVVTNDNDRPQFIEKATFGETPQPIGQTAINHNEQVKSDKNSVTYSLVEIPNTESYSSNNSTFVVDLDGNNTNAKTLHQPPPSVHLKKDASFVDGNAFEGPTEKTIAILTLDTPTIEINATNPTTTNSDVNNNDANNNVNNNDIRKSEANNNDASNNDVDGNLSNGNTESTLTINDNVIGQRELLPIITERDIIHSASIPKNSKDTESAYIDEVAPIVVQADITSREEEEEEDIEHCLGNRERLPRHIVMDVEKAIKKLSRLVTKINKQQAKFCRPDVEKDQTEYHKCGRWRSEKMTYFYQLMRLSYCGEYDKYPNPVKFKRAYNNYLSLYERIYAFNLRV
uniref:TIL domain-containing protein n=1 Tax=Rhabditophanes sp. KR3021 TaxID=114890 RepID=A0AC35TJT5_9BILA